MRRSIIYTLLITWFLFSFACKTAVVQNSVNSKNTGIAEDINPVERLLIQIYLPNKKNSEQGMSRVIPRSETEIKRAKSESNLTNFLVDLLSDKGRDEIEKNRLDFQLLISCYNCTRIRTSPIQGGKARIEFYT